MTEAKSISLNDYLLEKLDKKHKQINKERGKKINFSEFLSELLEKALENDKNS